MFFDLQVNGAVGVDFSSDALTEDGITTVVDELAKHHTTGFAPTVITSSFETAIHALKTLAAAAAFEKTIPVFHLEGPYISGEDGPRGAHPKEHVRDPDWDEFQRFQAAANGRIKLMTLAPERAGAFAFIEKLTAANVVVAIGHTAASPAIIRDAVKAGAKLSTHLGNGSHALMPRHDNYFWEQLGCDDLWASVIADGHHLPPAMLRTIVRTKGVERLILISDASRLAGRPPGRYRHWGAELEVEPSGRIGVAGTPYLAGSGSFLDVCAAHIEKVAGLSPVEIEKMTWANPRRLLGLPIVP
jgi:N-acetylglucosamine-6-phosphate deacetylase